jgi:hypothetical protein
VFTGWGHARKFRYYPYGGALRCAAGELESDIARCVRVSPTPCSSRTSLLPDDTTSRKKATMSGDRFEVNVTFDAAHGYVASAPELRQPMVALSLGGLRRRIEI